MWRHWNCQTAVTAGSDLFSTANWPRCIPVAVQKVDQIVLVCCILYFLTRVLFSRSCIEATWAKLLTSSTSCVNVSHSTLYFSIIQVKQHCMRHWLFLSVVLCLILSVVCGFFRESRWISGEVTACPRPGEDRHQQSTDPDKVRPDPTNNWQLDTDVQERWRVADSKLWRTAGNRV